MSQLQFTCPNCSFSKVILQSEIPSTAKQCKCPGCRKILDLAEAITPLKTSEGNQQSVQGNQGIVDKKSISSQQDSTEERGKPMDKCHELLEEALSNLNENNELGAMFLLEEAEKLCSTPRVRSYLGYCRAKVKNEYSDAIQACLQTLKEEPRNAEHYLNLGRIYLLADRRGPAIQTLRKGLKLGPNPQLMQELRKFERRKLPVISSLPRDHAINRNLGKLLSRLKLR